MAIKGTIFHHSKFVFKNGELGNKLLVLLNTPSKNDPYLFVRTTTQKKDKPSTPGCIKDSSLFFIPANTVFFEEDTWIQLYDIYPFTADHVKKDPEFKIIGDLKPRLVDKIVDCLFLVGEEDILHAYEKLLRPPLKKSLQQLVEKFRKK